MRIDLSAMIFIFTAFAACTPASVPPPASTATPAPMLAGSVQLHNPPQGAVIYAEVMLLQGEATDLPEDQLRLVLTGPEGEIIAGATVQVTAGTWQTLLIHHYNGEPIEVTLSVYPADPAAATPYIQQPIVLAGLRYRPEGASGSILFPAEGDTVGGQMLLVTGTASGVPEHTLTIDLLNEDGQMLTRTYASTTNPYLIDEMPWRAELATHDHIGPATLRLGMLDEAENTVFLLDAIDIIIDTAAG